MEKNKDNKYQLANEFFDSKEKVKERVRKILYKYKPFTYLNDYDFKIIYDLLTHHKNFITKVGCGVKAFYTMPTEDNPKHNRFMLVRIDGSEEDFSYIKCIVPEKAKKDIVSILRKLVLPQTNAYKVLYFKQNTWVSEFSGEPLTFETSHVDHKSPKTFNWLVNEFLKLNKLTFEEIKTKSINNVYDDTLEDKTLEEKWIDFHLKEAELRIVTINENLSILNKKVYER